jgi:hypothetical protein
MRLPDRLRGAGSDHRARTAHSAPGPAPVLLALVALAAQRPVASNTPWRGAAWFEQAESYLMLYERWYMFAPEAPRTDMNVSIDAVTAERRHVDPFNELASPGHRFPGTRIPPHPIRARSAPNGR